MLHTTYIQDPWYAREVRPRAAFALVCSALSVCHLGCKTQAERREDQIIIIAREDKQPATSLLLTPSFFLPSSAPHFHSLRPLLLSSVPATCSSPAPRHPRRVNSDHVWHFIGSLHFSPLWRLMGCSAINEYAKTRKGPRSGKGYVHTHTWATALLVAECPNWAPPPK